MLVTPLQSLRTGATTAVAVDVAGWLRPLRVVIVTVGSSRGLVCGIWASNHLRSSQSAPKVATPLHSCHRI